jgi:hypothetical protein
MAARFGEIGIYSANWIVMLYTLLKRSQIQGREVRSELTEPSNEVCQYP